MSDAEKNVLVTGASRGIGKAIAEHFAKTGAFVVGTATTAEGARSISDALSQNGLSGMGVVLDVRDEEGLTLLVEELTAGQRMPDILVNNAGITRDNLLLRMDDEEWAAVIDTNLTSVFRVTRAFLKSMVRKRYGRIISVGSVVGASGNAGQTNYCAAKAGLIGMMKALAQEVASRNITVNTVAPGFIATDMTAKLPDTVQDALLSRIPMKRLGNVEDIADAVLFLASSRASYITGQTIHVNGGMYMN